MVITLQFSAQGDLASRAIEYFEHGGYSHVDTVMPDGLLLGARNDVRRGIPAGVQMRPIDYAPFVRTLRTLRVTLPANDTVTRAYYDFIIAQIGKPYDKIGILAFVFDRDWREPDSWFCSELVCAGLEASGYFPFKLATPFNRLTPADCLLVCSATAPIVLPG